MFNGSFERLEWSIPDHPEAAARDRPLMADSGGATTSTASLRFALPKTEGLEESVTAVS